MPNTPEYDHDFKAISELAKKDCAAIVNIMTNICMGPPPIYYQPRPRKWWQVWK